MKEKAIVKPCSGYKESPQNHSYLDFCSECGNFWIDIPYCPKCDKRLNPTGYCGNCKKYYLIIKNYDK